MSFLASPTANITSGFPTFFFFFLSRTQFRYGRLSFAVWDALPIGKRNLIVSACLFSVVEKTFSFYFHSITYPNRFVICLFYLNFISIYCLFCSRRFCCVVARAHSLVRLQESVKWVRLSRNHSGILMISFEIRFGTLTLVRADSKVIGNHIQWRGL